MKTVIIGSDSIIGKSLEIVLAEYKPISISSLDINAYSKVELFSLLKKNKPKLIINCLDYYTANDDKESFKKLINIHFKSVVNLAKYCATNNVTLIHYSSDKVFRSHIDSMFEPNLPGAELDSTEPLDLYGEHKLQSEILIKKNIGSKGKFYIIRIPWCYAAFGDNLLLDLYKIAKKNNIVDAVSDVSESPVSALSVAKYTKHLIKTEQSSGTYHLAYEKDSITRADILELIKTTLNLPFEIQRVSAKYLEINRISKIKLASIKKTNFTLPELKKDLVNCINDIKNHQIS